jgi:UDP-N-acetylglucosamine acyltransferase
MNVSLDIGSLLRLVPSQYPFVLIDRVTEYDPKSGLVAVKNLTGSEEFFEGHFPGTPVMPGVLLMECLAQAAGVWLLNATPDPRRTEVHVVGIDGAKFRRPALPGDQLRLEVRLIRKRGFLCRMRGEVRCGDQRVAEATLLVKGIVLPPPAIDPTARIARGAELGPGVIVGPYCIVGPEVRLGARTVLDSHVVIDGRTTIGEDNRFFPFSSVGQVPQDLKYRGEASELVVGNRNVFREFITVHRGTAGGGGTTRVGSDNLFMAYVHIAHDCEVGSHTIFGNGATLAGHVAVADWTTIGGFSGVHQFCRIGLHAFMGGATVARQDVLPYSRTVGNRACIYGVNVVGLRRRGFSAEAIARLRHAYRILIQSGLNTSQALAQLDAEGDLGPEVRNVVDFIRSSKRGVILRRQSRRHGSEDE